MLMLGDTQKAYGGALGSACLHSMQNTEWCTQTGLQLEWAKTQPKIILLVPLYPRCRDDLVICKLWGQHARDVEWVVGGAQSWGLWTARQRAAAGNTLWCYCCH